jgi:iron complex transport system substrate-binding protein
MDVKHMRIDLSMAILAIILLCSNPIKAGSPTRIISLAPSLTKNLYLLDAGDLLVGCTNYCSIQAGTDASIVANAVQVNYEKIALLKPDLIITTTLTKTRSIENFKKLGIEVLLFENPLSFNQICDQFLSLGERIGKADLAREILMKAKDRVAELTNKIPNNPGAKSKVFMQIGANPLFTVVPETFMNDYILLSNTENIAADLEIGSINMESVILRNPDIIVIVLMGLIGEEESKKWRSFKNLNAVKKDQIFYLDADKACSPTPLSFVESLESIIKMFYPSSIRTE